MSTTALESCFTCSRRTDNFLCITTNDDVSGENVEAIFAKHFWFTKSDYQDRTVCTSCWEKIDDFHKFYCEVEKIHVSRTLPIKTETIDCSGDSSLPVLQGDIGKQDLMEDSQDNSHMNAHMFIETIFKVEMDHESNEDSKDHRSDTDGKRYTKASTDSEEEKHANYQSKSDPISEQNSDDSEGPDSEIPLAKRLRARKRKRSGQQRTLKATVRKENSNNDKLNAFIRQHIEISCHMCAETGMGESETFETFYRLRVHFKKMHDTNGYVFCCNRKWSSKTRLVEHLTNHEPKKIDQNRCLECNCFFSNKSSYANHMFLVHTPEDQKQFKCDLCSKAFAAEDLLNSHIKWHEEVEKKNHYCAICNKYFHCASNLESHNLSHHNFGDGLSVSQQNPTEKCNEASLEQPQEKRIASSPVLKPKRDPINAAKQDDLIRKYVSLNCSKCDFVGETFNKVSYHAMKVHNMGSHSISCCDRRFCTRQRLYEHCLRHLDPNHFKCDICGKTYADSSGLKIHKWWIHTPVSERPFKCDICGTAFVKDYQLKQHTNWHVNKERKTHFCELCNKVFSHSLQLKAHQQKIHGAVCDWVCDICAKGFVQRSLLEEHRLTHTKEGLSSLKVQCEKCQKWLCNKKSYFRHRRRCYDTDGPAKCDICGKESINKAALMGHKQFHHSNRPMFTCTFCAKECKTLIRLKEHEATHTGVVLYQCPYCPRTSNSSSNMSSHKKSIHPEQWAEEVKARHYTR